MTARALAILLVYALPLAAAWGALSGRLWALRGIVWVYFLFLLLDETVRLDTRDPEPGRAGDWRRAAGWRAALWFWPAAQGAMLLSVLTAIGGGSLDSAGPVPAEMVAAIALGATGGMLGIPIAHELMHGRSRLERGLAEVLMAMVSYTHFCIEHVQGHHRNVGTRRDPATARLGESFYVFYFRSVFGGLRSAWRLEARRLRRRGFSLLGPHNRMLRYLITLAAIYAAIAWRFGPPGVRLFAIQGIIAFSILEAINYVEHYGLARREIAPGRHEKIAPWHSWDSSHRVSNWLMFNIARHSDHHLRAGRGYLLLRHRDDAPQLPAGYFAMFALALFPPLWRRIMDPLVDDWRREFGTATA